MAWDDEKDTFRQRSDVPPDEKLTASEWNAHVTDQENHSGRHEDGGSDELSVDGLSGVLADAQTPQTEAVEDIVGALLAGGTNISLTYDDANDVLTIDTSALNEEEVEDAVAALVTAGGGITVNYDDAAGTLSIAVDESALSFYDGTNLTADVDNQSVTTERIDNDSGETFFDGSVDPLSLPGSAVATGEDSVAVGQESEATGDQSVAIGDNAVANRDAGVVIGWNAVAASDSNSVAIGNSANGGISAVAIGSGANTEDTSIALGAGVVVDTPDVARIGGNQLVFGGTQDTMADADLNNGELTVEMDESNSAFRLRGKDSTGTIHEATIPW